MPSPALAPPISHIGGSGFSRKPPLNAATKRLRSRPAITGPYRQPSVPSSVVPECSLSWSSGCLNDSIATPDGEREIHATGLPFQMTAGTNGVDCEESATPSTCGYAGRGGGLGTWFVTTCVVVVFVAAVWLRSELDDAVVLKPVELDPAPVARVDPPPQPASANTIAAAPHARGKASLTFRLIRAEEAGSDMRQPRDRHAR